jgi:hypothetical protein
MKRFAALSALLIALVLPVSVWADDGGGYTFPGGPSLWDGYAVAEQGCRTLTTRYDGGKTPEGSSGRATDGCNVYDWTSHVLQGPGSGTVTFTTTDKLQPWEGDLPSMAGGPAAYCQAVAVHKTNMVWMLTFKTGPGVEVTVRYECD